MITRQQAIDFLLKTPYKYARMLGFTKLGDLHNDWIIDMVRGKQDETLQASRGTYKTTCVSVALALLILLLPNYRTMFMRKTDTDVKEVIKQTANIIEDHHTQVFSNAIYGTNVFLLKKSATEITTNLTTDIKGTSQLLGVGLGASLTGKHFDRIFTDDIVNIYDRISHAEREKTKLIYQELQNVKNRDGRIFNTGTPWHSEDAFCIMPQPKRFDCYHPDIRKIITEDQLAYIKENMLPSLFAANYELRFVASEDVIFTNPQVGADPAMCENGIMHVDSAFYGEDYTAWSIIKKHDDKYYVYGNMKRRHVEDCYDDIKEDWERFMATKLYNEVNADKGMVAKELREIGIKKVVTYHEKMNKYLKIVTYLKKIWKDVIFVDGTSEEFIRQIEDYYIDAEHDDAADSLASLARVLVKKPNNENYKSLWVMGGSSNDDEDECYA